jgi:predicted alpha/beta hydrolase
VKLEPFALRAPDGRELAANWLAAARRRAVIVMNAGTGFPQSFYFKFAQYAADRGYDVLVYDYRGMGLSAPADLASETARMSDWGMLDMRAALDAGAARAQGLPVATVGHSVGGQFLGLLGNHALARVHVQIATSVGYWPWERAPFRYLAWWFWRVHGPLMLAIKGYIPTGGGWAGLPLPRGVYEEWRRWCLRPDHFGPDLETYLSDHHFSEIRAPLLSVGFTDDSIATRRTVDAMNGFYPNAARESRWYSPADAGSKRIGHEGFFASRHRDSLWRPVLDWLDGKLGLAA